MYVNNLWTIFVLCMGWKNSIPFHNFFSYSRISSRFAYLWVTLEITHRSVIFHTCLQWIYVHFIEIVSLYQCNWQLQQFLLVSYDFINVLWQNALRNNMNLRDVLTSFNLHFIRIGIESDSLGIDICYGQFTSWLPRETWSCEIEYSFV